MEAETVNAVREALSDYVNAPSQPTALRGALERMAGEAREKTMLPEQVLIVLKDIWYMLPGVQAIADPNEQVRLLQRVVTMCIKEYYAD